MRLYHLLVVLIAHVKVARELVKDVEVVARAVQVHSWLANT